MSLLLDALRRAAASKQGPEADQYTVPRRSDAPIGEPAPQTGMADEEVGELTLEPEVRASPAAADADPVAPAAGSQPVPPARGTSADRAPAARRATAGVLVGGRRGPGRRRAVTRVLLGLALVLAALAAIGAGGWWYYLESQRASQADLAAYRPTAEPLGRDETVAVAGTGAGARQPAAADSARVAPDSGDAQATTTAPTAAGDGAATTGEQPRQDAGTPAPEPAAAEKPDAGGTAEAATETGSGATAAADGQAGAKTATGAAATKAPAGAAPKSAQPARRAEPLVRASGPSELTRKLRAGYAALRAGDPDAAARAYARALALAPANRDALLGAASVAQRRGDPGRAAMLYRRVLRDHPRDAYARAALTSLEGANEPRRSETELKLLLHEQPESASLQFALGNVYAGESRWAEAQRAYFEAHRVQPDDADYAYNLAVALDHLGRREAARTYYRKALDAGAGQGAVFPVEAARRRLRQLQ